MWHFKCRGVLQHKPSVYKDGNYAAYLCYNTKQLLGGSASAVHGGGDVWTSVSSHHDRATKREREYVRSY